MKITHLFFVITAFFSLCFTHSVSAQDSEQVSMMKPFFAFAEMVQLAPVRETKDIGSPIVKLWVRDVLPTSPAYKAGLRKGMFIIQIQDLDVRGKTEKELHLETGKLSVVKDINVIVTPSLTSEKEISFSIPIPQSRREVIARN